MMAKDLAPEQRKISYGEARTFRGLEDLAIRRRLIKARKLLEILLHENPKTELQVLELGCGFWGRNLQMLSEDFAGVHFTGVDLTVAKEKTGSIDLVQADLTKWKPDRAYEGVLSLAVLEHLLDPQRHFELIAASLKTGGLAGLTTPTPPAHFVLEGLGRLGIFDRAEIKDHKMYFTEDGLRNLAKGAGLVVEEYREMSLGMNQWMLLRKP